MGAAATDSGPLPATLAEGWSKRALVTGMSGFTGRYVARELAAAGYRVFGTTHSAPADENMFTVDLCDRTAVAELVEKVRPDAVVHLAAIAYVPHSDPDAIYRVNLLGTRNLLAALAGLRNTPSAVLLASSANIYGNVAAPGLIDEHVSPAPVNDYAVSKFAMEAMARLWSDRLPIVIARPFNYTGVGQAEHFLIPKIVSPFRRGQRVIELGNTDIARDFSDVRVVASCYRRLLAAAPAGACFNVCSGRAHSLADILGIMAEIAGYDIDVRTNPAFVRASDVRELAGSNARLQGAIGSISQVPLAETLCWMFHA